MTGKVELVYEGEQEGAQGVARALVGKAVSTIVKTYLPDPAAKGSGDDGGRAAYRDVLGWFSKGNTVELDTDVTFADYVRQLDRVDGLAALVEAHTAPDSPAEKASMMELTLEMLHQHSLLGKDVADDGASYTDMMGSVLSGLGSFGSDDDDDGYDDEDDYPRRRR